MEKLIKSILDMQKVELKDANHIQYARIIGAIGTFELNEELGITIPESAKLSEILKIETGSTERLKKAIKLIEKSNPKLNSSLTTLIENIELSDKILYNIGIKIQHIDLKTQSGEFSRKLIDASEESIGRLGGEFTTEQSINYIIARTLNPLNGDLYDGALGVGNTPIECYKYSRNHSGNLKIYGQEINTNALAVATINLLMNGCTDFELELGDTIRNPKFKEGLKLRKFDYITMNIPWGMPNWGWEEAQEDIYNRYKYGMPPKSNSEYGFIQHTISSLKENGKAALVVTMGSLFRGALEGKIREGIINDDLIEGIISLPAGLFTSTAIPVAILILNKSKQNKNKIFLVKANELGTKERTKVTLSQEEIDKIIKVYGDKEEVEGFSKIIDIQDIEDNNLNLEMYFDKKQVETDYGTFKINTNKFENKEKTIPFENLAEFIRGMNAVKKVDENEATHKAVMLSDVQEGELNLYDLTPIKITDINRNKKYILRKGDVLLSCRGNVIKVAVVENIQENVVLSHNFIAIRPHYGVNPYFIKAYLESPVGKYYISKRLKGMTVLTLSVSDLNEMPFPNVESNKQQEIGEKLIQAKISYNKRLKEIKEQLKEDTFEIYSDLGISEVINKL